MSVCVILLCYFTVLNYVIQVMWSKLLCLMYVNVVAVEFDLMTVFFLQFSVFWARLILYNLNPA